MESLNSFLSKNLNKINIKNNILDRFEFGGLSVPEIFRDSPREQQERYVLLNNGRIEFGKAMLTKAIHILPLKSERFISKLAFLLDKKFGTKLIVEPGAFANPGAAASFDRYGNYISLPIADVVSDALSYQTYHELVHLLTFQMTKNEMKCFLSQLKGDGIKDILGESSIYSAGFSLDELIAYPLGTSYSQSLRQYEETERQIVNVLLPSRDEWKVLNVPKFGNRGSTKY